MSLLSVYIFFLEIVRSGLTDAKIFELTIDQFVTWLEWK